MAEEHWDFFISYSSTDRPWAEWIAWQLEAADLRVLFQEWDFVPGSHWMTGMGAGIRRAERTIAVLSHAYLHSVYGRHEWEGALRADPQGFTRKLIPVRIEDCPRPDLLDGIVSFDLFGYDPEDARRRLLDSIKRSITGRAKPDEPPPFPVAGKLRSHLGSTDLTPPSRPRPSAPPSYPDQPDVISETGNWSPSKERVDSFPERETGERTLSLETLAPRGNEDTDSTGRVSRDVIGYVKKYFVQNADIVTAFIDRALGDLAADPQVTSGSTPYVRLHFRGIRPTLCYINPSGRVVFKLDPEHVPARIKGVELRSNDRNGFGVGYYLRSVRDLDDLIELLDVAVKVNGGTRREPAIVPPEVARYIARNFPRISALTIAFVERAMKDLAADAQPTQGETPYIRLHIPGIRPALCYVNPSGRIVFKITRKHVPRRIKGAELGGNDKSGFQVGYYLRSEDDIDTLLQLLEITIKVQRGV